RAAVGYLVAHGKCKCIALAGVSKWLICNVPVKSRARCNSHGTVDVSASDPTPSFGPVRHRGRPRPVHCLTLDGCERRFPRMDAQRGIARRMVIGLPTDGLTPAWERDFSAYPPAGVIIFRRDFQDLADLRRLTSKLRELGRPRRLFLAIDEEGGHVSQLAGHLEVPPNALTLARGAEPGDLEWIAR